MILTNEASIKINESNYLYYEELGYDVHIGERLVIPLALLSTGSHLKISCQCDGCIEKGIVTIKDVIFKNYIKYGNRWGEYYCRKCSEVKRKKSLKLNHGVEYPIQNKEIKKRIQKTMVEKWGFDNPSKCQEILDKKCRKN